MVFTRRFSPDEVRLQQNDIDDSLRRVVESGFLKPTAKKNGAQRLRVVKPERGGREAVVETVRVRLTPAQIQEKKAADAAARRQKEREHEELRRRTDAALQIVRNAALLIEDRIDVAESLGFDVIFRGREGPPRRVILRQPETKERLAVTLLKGKNRRRERRYCWR